MSKRCSSCQQVNSDDRLFCSHCGEPLSGELKFHIAMRERELHDPAAQRPINDNPIPHAQHQQPKPQRKDDYNDEPISSARRQEPEKKSMMPLVLAGLAVLAALAYFLLT